MKVSIVGPGIMPIPPTGWGAVEILIWDQKLALEDVLKKRFDSEIYLQTEIDETLVGGAVIRTGDVVIDGSLRASLSGLSNVINS